MYRRQPGPFFCEVVSAVSPAGRARLVPGRRRREAPASNGTMAPDAIVPLCHCAFGSSSVDRPIGVGRSVSGSGQRFLGARPHAADGCSSCRTTHLANVLPLVLFPGGRRRFSTQRDDLGMASWPRHPLFCCARMRRNTGEPCWGRFVY